MVLLVGHRANKAEAKVSELETKVHTMEVEHKAFKDVAIVEVNALKQAMADIRRDVLTEKYFKAATESQNTVINHTNEAVTELKDRVERLDRSKASKSEMNLLAARPPARRSDGAYVVVAPHPSSNPPPMRAKLPSHVP